MTRGLSSDSEQEKERELNSRQTQLLSHFDEIPRRVERDSALNDQSSHDKRLLLLNQA